MSEEAEQRERLSRRFQERRLAELVRQIDAVQIYERITEQVIGQDVLAALIANKVSDSLLLEKTGKPRCSVFLSGEAGLGKTFMAEIAAKEAYPDVSEPYRIIPLGGVTTKEELGAKLRGVGSRFHGGPLDGELIEYLKRNQSTGGVVIFDEIDKPLGDHPDQQNLFLQMLDKGTVEHADGGEPHSLEKFVLFFTANASDAEFTQKAREVYAKHSVEIDQARQRPVLVPRNSEISKPFEQILTRGETFKEPFTRRLDLIAGVERPSKDDETFGLRLAEVILKKTYGKHFKNFDGFEELEDDEVMLWLTEQVIDPEKGPSRAEREFLTLFEEQLADILRARINHGLERKFSPRLDWDAENKSPLLVDKAAPYE